MGSFTLLEQSEFNKLNSLKFKGKILTSDGQSLAKVGVKLIINNELMFETNTDNYGQFSLRIPISKDSKIVFEKEGYHSQFITSNLSDNTGKEGANEEFYTKLTLFKNDDISINPKAFELPSKIVRVDEYNKRVLLGNSMKYLNLLDDIISVSSYLRMHSRYQMLQKPLKSLPEETRTQPDMREAHNFYQHLLKRLKEAKTDGEKARAQRSLRGLNDDSDRMSRENSRILREFIGISGAKIELFNEKGKSLYSVKSNAEGKFTFYVFRNKKYKAVISAKNYRSTYIDIDTRSKKEIEAKGIALSEIRMYFALNLRINEKAFDKPYAILEEKSDGFGIRPNPEFKKAINQTVHTVDVQLTFEEGEYSDNYEIFVFNEGQISTKLSSSTDSTYKTTLYGGKEFLFVVHKEDEIAIASLNTLYLNEDSEKVRLLLKFKSRDSLLVKGLTRTPFQGLTYDTTTNSFVQDSAVKDYFEGRWSGKIPPPKAHALAPSDSNLVLKGNNPKSQKELKEILITEGIQRINRSREERVKLVKKPQTDQMRNFTSQAHKKKLKRLYSHQMNQSDYEIIASYPFQPRKYEFKYTSRIGFSEYQHIKRIGYQREDHFLIKTRWTVFTDYFYNSKKVPVEVYRKQIKM